METSVRSLKALGEEQESYGTMLTSVLLTKLPPEIRLIMTRKSPSEDIDLETLLKVWEEEFIAESVLVIQTGLTVTLKTGRTNLVHHPQPQHFSLGQLSLQRH